MREARVARHVTGDQIELHDSRVRLRVADDTLILTLCPAYVHHWERSSAGWRGEGRSQWAEIVVAKASTGSALEGCIFEVADGWFRVGARAYDNLLPVPLDVAAPVRGRLALVNAEPVELSGEGINVRLLGEPTRLEDLPAEWAPEDGPVAPRSGCLEGPGATSADVDAAARRHGPGGRVE